MRGLFLIGLSAAAIVIAVNICFAALLIWQASLPVEPFKIRVQQAFAAGDLGEKEYLDFDARRGIHQFNDCQILQMMIRDGEPIKKALAPSYQIPPCTALFSTAHGGFDDSLAPKREYSRHWHGYLPITAGLLAFFELSGTRTVLKCTAFLSLVLLIVAAGIADRRLLVLGGSVAATGALFWALPYFGQSLCHGPGDAFVILGLSCILFWRVRLSQYRTFIPFCAAYGAGVVYLEFMTGLLPTAAGFLLPFGYAVAATQRPDEGPLRWLEFAVLGLTGFGLGVLSTVVIKQILVFVFVDQHTLGLFLEKILLYTQTGEPDRLALIQGAKPFLPEWIFTNPVAVFLLPFGSLVWNADILTYGSQAAGWLLLLAAGVAWLVAGYLAMCSGWERRVDLLVFAGGAAIIFAWVALLPTHTLIHAWLMVRILIVPVALGWAALGWQLIASDQQSRLILRRA